MTTSTHAMHHNPAAAVMAVAEYELQDQRKRDAHQWRQSMFYSLGRMLLASLFLVSAIAKLAQYDATITALRDVIAAPRVLLPMAIAVELVCGAMLLLGFKSRGAALVLGAYLISVTALVHHDFSNALNQAFALANLAFVGALLMVFAHGSGAASIDRVRSNRH